jgi:tetratricopeptide (TPR) repeat protein
VARAARALPDPDACADLRGLASNVEPAPAALAGSIAVIEDDLARARVQLAAGNAGTARTGGAGAVAAARAIGYRPLLAEALLVEGHARMVAEDYAAAAARLAEATTIGFAAGSDAVAIEAWARRAWVEGTGEHPELALAGFAVIDALATRTASAFARALLHNNVGGVELGRGDRPAARAMFERALDDAKPVTGAGAVELVAIRSNTALTTDDPERRDALYAEAHGELVRLLGAGHPDTLLAQAQRAVDVAGFARAAELLAPACELRELHAWLAGTTAECWVELADLRSELGDRTAALAALDRAVGLGAATNPQTPEASGYRLLWRGEPDRAAAAFEAAVASTPGHPDDPWYQTFVRARLLLGLGRAREANHQPGAAEAALVQAITALEPIARHQPAAAVDRRLGRARAELARIRAATGAAPGETRELATAALAWMRAAGAPADQLAELQRLTGPADSPGSPR